METTIRTGLPKVTWTPIWIKNPARRWWQFWKPRWILNSKAKEAMLSNKILEDLSFKESPDAHP